MAGGTIDTMRGIEMQLNELSNPTHKDRVSMEEQLKQKESNLLQLQLLYDIRNMLNGA